MRELHKIYASMERTTSTEISCMSDSHHAEVQSWTETMTARERIRAVVQTLTEPQSVNWISTQADAAWSTTNDELQDLATQGRVRRGETGDTTLYQPDHTRLLFDEVRRLVETNTREDLRAELTTITEELEDWRDEYHVETWQDLEQTLADDDLSSAALRERRDVIAFWRENERDRRLIKHALALYGDIEDARERTADALAGATS